MKPHQPSPNVGASPDVATSWGVLRLTVLLSVASMVMSPRAEGQDFTRELAGADRIFSEGILPEDLAILLDPTLDGYLKGQIGYNLAANVIYDSNVNLSATDEQDDIYFTINPSVFYTSDPEGGARHRIDAFYAPNPEFFRNESTTGSSGGRFNHNGGVSYQFNGARTSISAFLTIAQESGSDRFTNSYSEGTVARLGLSASYQLAPRTSIYGSFSTSQLSYSTAGQQGGDYLSTNLGASWAATERLNFGPSVRYTSTESTNIGSQTALGLLFNASYKATDLINLSASIGAEAVENSRSGGNSDPRLTGSLAFNYSVSPIWNWSGSISYANIPAPDTFGYVANDLQFSTSLSRSLDIGSLSGFVSYSTTDYEAVGRVTGPNRDGGDYYGVGLRYGRPFISDRISFSTSLSYLQSSGDRDWSKWILAMSWSTSF